MPPVPAEDGIARASAAIPSAEDAIARARAFRDAALPAATAPFVAPAGASPRRWTPDYAHGVREAAFAGAGLLALAYVLRSGIVRYRVETDIPGTLVRRRAALHGYVMRVTDGDGLRFYHQPWLRRVLFPGVRKMRKISGETINVRLAAVDAPEMSHYGVPGQPFGKEAKEFLRALGEKKQARLTLHQFDQYKRIIGTVEVKHSNRVMSLLGLGKKNVSMELAKNGYAIVYKGPNACYGKPGIGAFDKAVSAAKKARKGMWSQKSVVTPTEFKAQLRKDALNGGASPKPGKASGQAMVLFPTTLVTGILNRVRGAVGLTPPPNQRVKEKKKGFFSL